MRLLVVSASPPDSSRSWPFQRRMAPQPPGPGLPEQAPSVHSSSSLRHVASVEADAGQLSRGQPLVPGPVRHPPAGRPHRRAAGGRRHRRRRPRLHRAHGHVLPGHRRRRGPSHLQLQGRRAGVRAGAGRAHDRLSQLRRQRHVPVDGKPAREPARGPAVHRLRAAPADAAGRRRRHRRARSAARRLPRGAVRGAGAGHPRLPNCPRYIHQMQLVDRSRFVPRSDCETPAPGWKRRDWSRDVLPADDPAADPSRESLES